MRSTRAQMQQAADDLLERVLADLGRPTRRADAFVVELSNGTSLVARAVPAAVVDAPRAGALAASAPPHTVVVGDLITRDARTVLDAARVGWLDRRGHARLVDAGVWIDRSIDAAPRRPTNATSPVPAIRGVAAISVAVGHLIDPVHLGGVRPLAALIGLSPAGVSRARRSLHAAGLLGTDPETRSALFAGLAAAWRPGWVDVIGRPAARVDLVASGTLAAAVLGVPIIARQGHPLELYAASSTSALRMRLRTDDSAGSVGARVAIAPTPLVHQVPGPEGEETEGFAIAHPLFVALDLAADPARGAEALLEWEPRGWDRAW